MDIVKYFDRFTLLFVKEWLIVLVKLYLPFLEVKQLIYVLFMHLIKIEIVFVTAK